MVKPAFSASMVTASFTPRTTALDVMVAAVIASISPPFFFSATGAVLPANCSIKAGSLDLAPRPAVSLKFAPPTLMP